MVDRAAHSGPLERFGRLGGRSPPPLSRACAPTAIKTKEQFRDYRAEAKPEVKEFYRLNHQYQTVDFVRAKRADYLRLNRRKMGLWDGLEFLNTLVDSSDPDTSLAQIEHLLQTAEAIRRDGHPRWFILTGLIHDFGKVLCLFGEPQWASSATRSRWVARTPTRSCSLNFWRPIRRSRAARRTPGARARSLGVGARRASGTAPNRRAPRLCGARTRTRRSRPVIDWQP